MRDGSIYTGQIEPDTYSVPLGLLDQLIGGCLCAPNNKKSLGYHLFGLMSANLLFTMKLASLLTRTEKNILHSMLRREMV